MRPGRARPGQGRGGLDRADPRPDPAVALGPARRRRAGAGGRLPVARPSATRPTRGSTGCGSASSCRRSCGRSAGPWSAEDIAEDLATARLVRARRRLVLRRRPSAPTTTTSAGPCTCTRRCGRGCRAPPTCAATRQARDVAALDRFLQDAVALVGADGSPLIQGRSLIYRFAAAAPFWVGRHRRGAQSLSPGQLRRAASEHRRALRRARRPRRARPARPSAGTARGARWRSRYSGPGSPYWAAKGMLGIALPADHPVWTADEEPLPVEVADDLRRRRARRAGSSRDPRRRHRPRRQPRHRPRGRGLARRRLAALRAARATRPRPARCSTSDGVGRAARPVGRAGRRRRPGDPPLGHDACCRCRVDGRRRRRGSSRRRAAHWRRRRPVRADARLRPRRHLRRRRHRSPRCPSCAAPGRSGPSASTTPTPGLTLAQRRLARGRSSRPSWTHGVRGDGRDRRCSSRTGSTPRSGWTRTPARSAPGPRPPGPRPRWSPAAGGSPPSASRGTRTTPPTAAVTDRAADRDLARRPRDHGCHLPRPAVARGRRRPA